DLLERDREGLVGVDLKTAARKYTDVQVEASLQLSIYRYAAEMGGLADQGDVRLRFDVLTKTKQPELHRYWTSRGAGRPTCGCSGWGRGCFGGSGGGVPAGRGVAGQGMHEPVLGVAVTSSRNLQSCGRAPPAPHPRG